MRIWDVPGRARLVGDGRYFSEGDGQARIALRCLTEQSGWCLTDDQAQMIEAIAEQFQNTVVSAGCIKGGKLRRDKLFVRLYLLRRLTRLPPRRMNEVLGLDDRYLRYALERGRRLVEASEHDGRIEAALDQFNRLRQADDEPDRA